MSNIVTPQAVHEVDPEDLPVSCPGPHTPVWNLHPKVYLELATTGSDQCPYCGTLYRLKGGALPPNS